MYMNTQRRFMTTTVCRKGGCEYLSVVWILSILLGAIAVIFTSDLHMVIVSAIGMMPSPALLCIVNTFPGLLLIVLFAAQKFSLVFATMFLYGLFHGFCGMGIVLAYGSGSWLIRCLLLFSSGAVSVLLWWLILSCVHRRCLSRLAFGYVLLSSFVSFFDYIVISPFLIGII